MRSTTLMSRVTKQLVILVLFFILVGGVSAAFYFLSKPEPTCFDGIQNQDEEGVDCGGACLLQCVTTKRKVEDLELVFVRTLRVSEGSYAAVAKLNNKNDDFGASRLSYEFQFFDARDTLIGSELGISYILPREERYIIEPRLLLPSDPRRVDFTIKEVAWERLRDYTGEPELFVRDQLYKRLDAGEANFSEFSGILKNASHFDFDTIYVGVVLINPHDETIGVGTIEIKTMKSGEERFFKIGWPEPFSGEVESIDVRAETNVFFSENYIRRHGTDERFQKFY